VQDTTELLGVKCEVKTGGACTYEESKGVQHHLRGNQGSRVIDTAGPGFEREQTPPVQGSRESRHRRSRVRERADITSPGFEREPTLPFQGLRENRHCQFRV